MANEFSVKQIYEIANAVNKMAFGQSAINVIDTASFISHGDYVFSSDKNKEVYTEALTNLIGRTIYTVRLVKETSDGISKHPFEFGLILRKIYADVSEAHTNNSWNIGSTNYTPKFAPIMKPEIKEYMFSNISTYEYGVTIPDYLYRTALRNPEEYAALIDTIMTAMENTIRSARKNLNNIVRADMMANVLANGTKVTKVNLLARYNEETEKNLTAKAARRDKDFLMFANQTIGEYVTKIGDGQNVLFNQKGFKRYTPKEKAVLSVLTNYAKASEFYLESSTFHDTLVKLPMYNEVSYWQGTGESYMWDDVSTINVTTVGGKSVTQSGIIATLHDYETIGTMIDAVRTPTERNNHDEYTNYYHKEDRGYLVDMSENAIVFYIADPENEGVSLSSSIGETSISAETAKSKKS